LIKLTRRPVGPAATVADVEDCDRLTVVEAYRFALDPSPGQVRDLLRHAGAARLAHDWGLVKAKLRLSERVFACTTCGLVLDRDTNATNNLPSPVKHVVAGSGPEETQNGRGADPKTRPARAGACEPSTPRRAVPARAGRGPSLGNGRITEIH
jgi:putative transposase